jgi:hypothetical protein
MISFSYVPSEERKLIISASSLKTCQLVMLSGTKGLKSIQQRIYPERNLPEK